MKLGTKGVPHSSKLTLENFRDKLYGHIPHTVVMRQLRVMNGEGMSRTSFQKQALSDLFSKFRVSDDMITCTPLTVENKFL